MHPFHINKVDFLEINKFYSNFAIPSEISFAIVQTVKIELSTQTQVVICGSLFTWLLPTRQGEETTWQRIWRRADSTFPRICLIARPEEGRQSGCSMNWRWGFVQCLAYQKNYFYLWKNQQLKLRICLILDFFSFSPTNIEIE